MPHLTWDVNIGTLITWIILVVGLMVRIGRLLESATDLIREVKKLTEKLDQLGVEFCKHVEWSTNYKFNIESRLLRVETLLGESTP